MAAAQSKAKTFSAVLERMEGNLGWVIIRIPFDAAKIWSKRGQLRVQGEINSFSFTSTLFPNGKGGHFLLVNKKMQKGGKTAAGLKAKFHLQPDSAPKKVTIPEELLNELGQSKRLLKFFQSMSHSMRNWISKWVADPKSSDARTRRAQQIAEGCWKRWKLKKSFHRQLRLCCARIHVRVRDGRSCLRHTDATT